MKVALVVPEYLNPRLTSTCPPVGLGSLIAYTWKFYPEIEFKIVDGAVGQNITKELFKFQPSLVGVTATTPLAPSAYALLDMLKRNRPDIKTVMGGIHASIMPYEAIIHANHVVVGEGELAFLEIIEGLLYNKHIPKILERPVLRNLDDIPFLPYKLMDIPEYIKRSPRFPYGLDNPKPISLLTSRGCPYHCVFCVNSKRKTPVRYHSAERVLQEINYFYEQFGINAIFFNDDEFIVNKKRLKEIAVLLELSGLNKKIRWGCQARADTLDIETLKLMKNMGCECVSPGFESGNQRVLDYLKCETITVTQNQQAIDNASNVGITIGGSFIFGTPSETLKEMKQTFDFFERNNELTFIGTNILTPYPNTQVWDDCKELGLLPEKVDYALLVPPNDPREGYVLCNTMSQRKFRRVLLDFSRTAFMLTQTRLINKYHKHRTCDFLKLAKLHVWWYILICHPIKFLKMFKSILERKHND